MKFKVGDRVKRTKVNALWRGVFGEQTEGVVTYVGDGGILVNHQNQDGVKDTNDFNLWGISNFELVDSTFKVGDRVECIENLSQFENKILTIIKIEKLDGDEDELLYFRNVVGGWYKKRFKLLKELQPTETQQHTHNGGYHQYITNDISSLYSSLLENDVVTPQEGEKKMNKMLQLYKTRKMEQINKKYDIEVNERKNTKSELTLQLNQIIDEAGIKLRDLYLSQFTPEQLLSKNTFGVVDTTGMELVSTGDVKITVTNLHENKDIMGEDIEAINYKRDQEISELHLLIDEIEAALELSQDSTDVLIRYGVLDKKLKLNVR